MVDIRDGGIIDFADCNPKDEFEMATTFFLQVTFYVAAQNFSPDAVQSALLNALRNHAIKTGIEPAEFKKILQHEIAIFDHQREMVMLANQTEGEA